MRTFRGYVWLQWFQQNFSSLLTIFAALLGSGSPLVKSGSGALFSLALPVSRGRWIAARAGAGLAELLCSRSSPVVAFAALAPFVGEQLSVGEALVYGACSFVGASVFFAVAVFISSLVNDVWRPLLLTCLLAVAIGAVGSGVARRSRAVHGDGGRQLLRGWLIALDRSARQRRSHGREFCIRRRRQRGAAGFLINHR